MTHSDQKHAVSAEAAAFQFLPIATVSLAADGTLTLDIDWSGALAGQWNEATSQHDETPLAERVAAAMDAYLDAHPTLRNTPVVIGRLAPAVLP